MRFNALAIDPARPETLAGPRQYFLSVGQSAGPIRSNPLMPSLAASRHMSSIVAPRANTPRVTPCLIRPLRGTGDVVWEACEADGRATTNDAVTAPRNSLRRIRIQDLRGHSTLTIVRAEGKGQRAKG